MQEVDDIVSQEAYHHAGLVLAKAGAVRLVQEEAVLFLLDVVLHRPPFLYMSNTRSYNRVKREQEGVYIGE